jgi:hypothetical protein
MNENTRKPSWADGDLHTVAVSMPDHYAFSTERPLHYAEVHKGDVVLGYLWVASGEEAAGYEPRAAAGDDGGNTGVRCYDLLREAKAAGVPADSLMTWFRSRDEAFALAGAEREAEHLTQLRELAATS